MASDRLLRFTAWQYAASWPWNGGPQCRVSSPRAGASILTTSAPRSARIMVLNGPDRIRVRSRTRTPRRAPSRSCQGEDPAGSVTAHVVGLVDPRATPTSPPAASRRSWVLGMSSKAIIDKTQQPTMYQLIPVLEFVALRMAAAMSGAGPPAMTEASWYPNPAALVRRLVPKLSAMSAAWGPYIMSWTISETTMATSASHATLVFNRPKSGNAYRAMQTMPMPYMSRRPILSDRNPKKGTLPRPTAAATRV